MRPAPLTLALAGGATLALLAGIAACAPQGDQRDRVAEGTTPVFELDPEVPVVEDLVYATADDEELRLDICLPPDDAVAEAEDSGEDHGEAPDTPRGDQPDLDPVPLPTPERGPTASPTPDEGGAVPEGEDAEAAEQVGLRPAILMVHGGSWTRGDKADVHWRATCQWLAKASGSPVANINYRLAPAHPFPAAFDDVRAAVTWLRAPEQSERYRIDPTRIGAFGGSAGGNLVSLLGTRGSGATDTGTRVAAVVDLSGPNDLTGIAVNPVFEPVQRDYLACAEGEVCDAAFAASPIYSVDETDPPFLVAHSSEELIPIQQSARFVSALRGAGVDTTFVEVRGTRHSVGMLDEELRAQIVAFFREKLADRPAGVVP
ncbi:alpha/beta hydrolase [Homoserinibacter sp. YIM 151385]|uniref:alpha/beta hydrolase n=1 Tax=Homoserinibacter sp. YIM 151385 TaxID=2985506 RepID=UPI0022F021F8|nr:alpha/beta hydrolase fold domain-containing protein [Homoserinibacter sp. YIM 151385]WBU37419.1 alpha/beta hydrolase fold domain-containing protein [Homoserinibacter sp. YIM 151385]